MDGYAASSKSSATIAYALERGEDRSDAGQIGKEIGARVCHSEAWTGWGTEIEVSILAVSEQPIG